MKKLIIKFNSSRKSGLSIIEVIVAISVSIITITVAASFAVSLMKRSQQTFFEESALQMQSFVNEQLRFLELSLLKEKKEGLTALSSIRNEVCDETTNYYKTNFPNFNSTNIESLALSKINISTAENIFNEDYKFDTFLNDSVSSFGPFKSNSSTGAKVSIKKTASKSGNYILLKTVIQYTAFGKTQYTKPQEIRYVYSLICTN